MYPGGSKMDSGESLLDFLCLVYTDFLNKREHRRQEEDFQNVRGVNNLFFLYSRLALHAIHVPFTTLRLDLTMKT